MATNFPGSLDSFTNPTSGSTLDSPSHAGQHANINDAMEAVQAKLGTGAGTIGEWTSFTPVWDGLTVGNGVQSFTYAVLNKVIFVQGRLTFGTTTSITGSFVRMHSPVSTFAGNLVGNAICREDGVSSRMAMVGESSGRAIVLYFNVSGSNVLLANINSTTPFTWGTNDYIAMTFSGELQ